MCFAREVQCDDTMLHDAYMVALATPWHFNGKLLRCQRGFDASDLEDGFVFVADEKSEQTFKLGLYSTFGELPSVGNFPIASALH